jgi:hypothetical protein
MLEYFLSTLEVRARAISLHLKDGGDQRKLLDEVQEKLAKLKSEPYPANFDKDFEAWNEAYGLARLLVLLEPAENLSAELRRRVAEATSEKIGCATRLAAASEALLTHAFDANGAIKPGEESKLRGLLLETMEELHLGYQRKFYARPIRRNSTTRLIMFGFGAFVAFMFPYVMLYYKVTHSGSSNDSIPSWTNVDISSWAWLPLWSALTAGLFGAMFSRLLFLQSHWSTMSIGSLKAARESSTILLRGCVGMMGAVIVSFFLQAHVIAGGLFPDFQEIGLERRYYPVSAGPDNAKASVAQAQTNATMPSNTNDPHAKLLPLLLIYPNQHLALLIVWSFLAGFSERLVPTILKDTESSAEKAAGEKPS